MSDGFGARSPAPGPVGAGRFAAPSQRRPAGPPSSRPGYTPPSARPGASPGGSGTDAAAVSNPDAAFPSAERSTPAVTGGRPPRTERGLAGWQAVVVLIVIAGIGGLIDLLTGTHVRGGFNYGIVLASLVAILVVRRSSLFPVVVAPPLVYFIASAALLVFRSNGLNDKKVVIDAAANWLVYGFPAIAAASAVVLIIAGVRLITNR